MAYVPKVYRDLNGDRQVIAPGGTLLMEPGSFIQWANPTGAADYFVDLNVAATGDGTLQSPFPTLAEAIAASNTSIGLAANRWWARRNRIFVMGDGITEDLTVLPEKCDIIGFGSDLYPFPRIIGNHAIVLAKVGVRWINIGFQSTGAGAALTYPAGCHGYQFVNCVLIPTVTGSTIGLSITDSAMGRIMGCRVDLNAGNPSAGIFAKAVSILGTVGHDTEIIGNRINATEGISVQSTIAGLGSIIAENLIRATNLAINDDSDTFQVVNNRWITDINTGTSTAGWDFNLQLAVGNIQMGATGLCDSVPFMKIAE